ncbi:hypothetical protein CERZMDRAFT_119207 [Cercospora zeae-maydis SCOH1-5]|uniref:Uncharacterized protein n=1 Tax=Cercospora zeae-maydis SCOH1-5 TaxID=717836 RepID=A0A6A6F0P5_9PEZI|nr:hypothetical protein CERZMDRAFT_119207 [Cercospora zeae-maydis SCOH1-5]
MHEAACCRAGRVYAWQICRRSAVFWVQSAQCLPPCRCGFDQEVGLSLAVSTGVILPACRARALYRIFIIAIDSRAVASDRSGERQRVPSVPTSHSGEISAPLSAGRSPRNIPYTFSADCRALDTRGIETGKEKERTPTGDWWRSSRGISRPQGALD